MPQPVGSTEVVLVASLMLSELIKFGPYTLFCDTKIAAITSSVTCATEEPSTNSAPLVTSAGVINVNLKKRILDPELIPGFARAAPFPNGAGG
jgi:hypothetical protein